jgi:hypothetical protein
MKIYKKCGCCGRMILLVMGSEFGNEVEFGSTFGGKDNLPHAGSSHEEDWHCLHNFLTCLSNSHGEVFISLREKDKKRIPKEFKKRIMEWTEGGYVEEEPKEKPKLGDTGTTSGDNSGDSSDPWVRAGFSALQKKEWVDIGLGEEDSDFASWLAKVKKLSPEEVLNYGSLEELKGEWEDSLPKDLG